MIATEVRAYSDTPLTRPSTSSGQAAERAYAAAEHDLRHWQKLILAGWLSAAQRYHARCEMVRAAGRKVRAERAMQNDDI